MILGKLGASLLENLLILLISLLEKNNYSWSKFLMPSHPLTSFEIQKYYQNETKFNGVYSRNNLPEIKDGT